MSVRKLQDSLTNLERAVSNLERALTIPRNNELVLEGTIHRFEIAIELTWKTLKRALEYEGFHPKSPRETLKEAFRTGWLDDEGVWLDMLDRRNTSSHIYLSDELVEENYNDIARITPILRKAVNFLKTRYLASPS